MNVGILTFHDEVNYGSLLQALAMQTVLQGLGHKPVIIDRRNSAEQRRIYGILHCHSLKVWLGWFASCVFGCGAFSQFVREWRSRRFIAKYLRLTDYHFVTIEEAPQKLGVSVVTVGSDQVWHPTDKQLPIYLMGWVNDVKKIAYSASFGVNELPFNEKPMYKAALASYKAIGLRELQGVDIVSELGIKATHVVDPTLLLNRTSWLEILGLTLCKSATRHVFAYFLAENYGEYVDVIDRLVASSDVMVHLYVQDYVTSIPSSNECIMRYLRYKRSMRKKNIKVCGAAGPLQFVRDIATADCVITNSFHALMFAIIFRKNVRVVESSHPRRKKMAARMSEFANAIVEGPLLFNTLSAAVASYMRGERTLINENALQERIDNSIKWLKESLKECE